MGKLAAGTIMASLAFLLLFIAAAPAEAGVVDRIKDIYNAPEKVAELREQFTATQELLEQQKAALLEQQEAFKEQQKVLEQQQQALLEQQRKAEAAELAAAQYREENAQLLNDNQAMQQRMEELEKDKSARKALYRKLLLTGITALGMGILYILSIRVWRYASWRRHQRSAAKGEQL